MEDTGRRTPRRSTYESGDAPREMLDRSELPVVAGLHLQAGSHGHENRGYTSDDEVNNINNFR